MDYQVNFEARKKAVKLLETSQKVEAELAKTVQDEIIKTYEKIVRLIITWLNTFHPGQEGTDADRRQVQQFTNLTLDSWINLQRELHAADATLQEARREEQNARKAFNYAAGPFGGIFSKVFDDKDTRARIDILKKTRTEAETAKDVAEYKRNIVVKALQLTCERFVRDVLENLQIVVGAGELGRKIDAERRELNTKLERLWTTHQEREIDALNDIQRALNRVRRSYMGPSNTPDFYTPSIGPKGGS